MAHVATRGMADTYIVKPAPRGKHVPLFKMRRKVGTASIPQLLVALMGSEDLQKMLKPACTLFCSALLRQLYLG